MLEIYHIVGADNADAISKIISKMNEIFENVPECDVTLSPYGTSNIYFQGHLWSGKKISTANCTMVVNMVTSWNIYVDIEKHFFALQNTSRMSSSGNDTFSYTLADTLYMETENGDSFGFVGITPIATTNDTPYFIASNVNANGSAAQSLNTSYFSQTIQSTDIGDDFSLVPLRAGISQMKNLYVCVDNYCKIGRIVNVNGIQYKCIGRQIFYKMED